jgi:DNA-binding NtrC family response regulator
VLIQGETGAGTELVAQAIHDAGPRRRRPLRSLNCGAIPPSLLESALFGHERGAFTGADRQSRGVFEEADGGTLLLDEIGELSGPAQAALLRVLETQRFCRVGSSREIRVDVRVIAATHQDLEEMVHAGRFRADLLYRLNTMVIHVPPLRERPEEILPLAERFARRTSQASRRRTVRFDPAATAALRVYRWPGNVRELRNAIERAVILAVDDLITVEELPDRVRSTAPTPPAATPAGLPPDIRGTLDQVEAQLLLDALMANDWNQSRTAAALGMPRRTLVYKLRRYGIRRKDAS